MFLWTSLALLPGFTGGTAKISAGDFAGCRDLLVHGTPEYEALYGQGEPYQLGINRNCLYAPDSQECACETNPRLRDHFPWSCNICDKPEDPTAEQAEAYFQKLQSSCMDAQMTTGKPYGYPMTSECSEFGVEYCQKSDFDGVIFRQFCPSTCGNCVNA